MAAFFDGLDFRFIELLLLFLDVDIQGSIIYLFADKI